MTGKKRLHQQFSELDNAVFSAFCDSFQGIAWSPDYKDLTDEFCGIDVQLTAQTKTKEMTYDIELKSRVTLNNFQLAKDCFFEVDKWYQLLHWDNDKKLYIAIYPNCDKIAIWNVTGDLLRKSEKDFCTMNYSFCGQRYQVEKQVYRFKMTDAKVYDFNLTDFRDKYNALYQQITRQKDKVEKALQQS